MMLPYNVNWDKNSTVETHAMTYCVILVIRHLDLDKFPIIHKKYV